MWESLILFTRPLYTRYEPSDYHASDAFFVGLFSEDDGLFSAGPLASEVSGATVRLMTKFHNINAKVILGLVALHLVAVTFYLIWKRENLITPMLTGWKWVRK